MTLSRFLKTTNITLPKNSEDACQKAIRLMTKSLDPLHSENHIFRMLDDLNAFMTSDSEINWKKINFEILLLSICWHDTWKSKKFPRSKKAMLYHNLVDGLGSMRVFGKHSKQFNLTKFVSNKTKYAIRKHSSFQFLPKRTLEAKILRDLDQLEEWSIVRVDEALGSSQKFMDLLEKVFNMAKYYFEHKMLTATDKKFYFRWSKKQFAKRRGVYLLKVGELMSSRLFRPFSETKTETNYPEILRLS